MHIGVARHLGWAVLVTSSDAHRVIDRRRIELVDGDLPEAPIHHRGGAHPIHADGEPLGDDELQDLVAAVRASAIGHSHRELERLVRDLPGSVTSLSLRGWRDDLPTDVASLRRAPHESRADSVMYREVLADAANDRGWQLHHFDARTVEREAAAVLGGDPDLLSVPRSILGPPWNKDHRMAYAAAILAAEAPTAR